MKPINTTNTSSKLRVVHDYINLYQIYWLYKTQWIYLTWKLLYSILHRRQTSAGHLSSPVLYPIPRYTGHMFDRLQLQASRCNHLPSLWFDRLWPSILSQ